MSHHSHFSDLEGGVLSTTSTFDDGEKQGNRKFHISKAAPTREHFVESLRADAGSVHLVKQVRDFGRSCSCARFVVIQTFPSLRPIPLCMSLPLPPPQVATKLPDSCVEEYAVDVLRRKSLSGLGTSNVEGAQMDEVDALKVLDEYNATSELDEENETRSDRLREWILSDTPRHMSVRLRTKIKLQSSPSGRSWDIFQVMLSIIGCLMHIVSIYNVNAALDQRYDMGEEGCDVSVDDEEIEKDYEKPLEYILSIFFATDLVLHFYACDHRIWFFTYPDTIVDILTLLPVVISLFGSAVNIETNFLRVLRILRAMRILRAFKLTKNSLSAVDQKVATLVIIVISIIFMSACCVQALESNGGTCALRHFGFAMYFVIVTISTVGYGDFFPTTVPGRFVVCIMIIIFMVVVPLKISELADLLAMRSPWHTHYRAKKGYRHIMVIGSVLEVVDVEAFLEEFFHPDRMLESPDVSLSSTDVVIMAPQDPNEGMVNLLLMPFWHGQVHYIHGSPLEDRDLQRAGFSTADACFILSGKRSLPLRCSGDLATQRELIDHYDSLNVLYALMVENFNNTVDSFVEIRCVEKRYPLEAAEADVVLCIDRLRMTVLGMTILYPGLSTLLSNLWQSCNDDVSFHSKSLPQWMHEYSRSRLSEIYFRPMISLFAGMTFSQAAFVVHRAFDGEVTLIGVEERIYADNGDVLLIGNENENESENQPPKSQHFRIIRSLVGPGDRYIFPDQAKVNAAKKEHGQSAVLQERLEIYGYFLATDGNQANLLGDCSAYERNVLHSLHEYAYLRQHLRFASPEAKDANSTAMSSPTTTLDTTTASKDIEDEPAGGVQSNDDPRPSPVKLVSVDVQDRILEDATERLGEGSSHLILLATPTSLVSIKDLLRPLRGSGTLKRPDLIPSLSKVIVIFVNNLQNHELPDSFLRIIADFPEVYAMTGDHNSVTDLHRAGIRQAQSILIMEDNDGMHGGSSGELNTATITKFLSTEQCLAVTHEHTEQGVTKGIKSYVVETNSKATIRVMNRSLVNRIAHEKEMNMLAERRRPAVLGASSNIGAAGGRRMSSNKVAPDEEATDSNSSLISANFRERKLFRIIEESKRQKEQEVLARQRALYSSDSYFSMTPFFAAG